MADAVGLTATTEPAPGLRLVSDALGRPAQTALAAAIGDVLAEAPPFTPRMPRTGKPFSVTMTNCGPLGWVADKDGGYRYQAKHPATGRPWPDMPAQLLQLWQEHAGYPAPPEACLVNIYEAGAKMGLHRDEDEADVAAPVLSISLGDDCLFRFGGTRRGGPTQSVRLHSGDVVVLGGASRLAYHGVDRIYPGTAPPGLELPAGARINLTLRRVTKPA